jgi:hypothetical protein
MLGSLGPARRKTFGISNNTQLYDPLTNAKAAHTIFTQSGFKAWSTYTSGAYKAHLTDAANGVKSVQPNNASAIDLFLSTIGIGVPGAGPITSAAQGILDPITSSLQSFSQNIFNGFANFAGIAIAGVLLVVGILLINHNSAGHVAKAATKVGEVAAL